MSQEERSNIIRFGKKNKPPANNSQPEEHKPHRSPRNTALYIGSVIILVIVVVTFVGAPAISSAVGGANRVVFGEYDGTEITYSPGNYFARQHEALAQQLADSGSTENLDAQVRAVWRQAFNRTVFFTAVMSQAEESGMTVSEVRVDRAVAQSPRFQENGRFSAEAYQQASSTEKFQLRTYLKESIVYDQFITDKISSIHHSQAELDFFKSLNSPERQFEIARFAFSDYPEEEVVAYGEENSFRFRRMELSSITINSSQQDASNVLQQYEDRTASFEDLARAHSRDQSAQDGGQLGEVYYFQLERDFEDPDVLSQVFALEAGEVSPLLETTFGWVFYRADSDVIEPDFEDEETVTAVRSYLNSFERGRVEDYIQEQAQQFAAEARQTGFATAANELGADTVVTGFFPINYGNGEFFGPVQTEDGDQISNAAFRDAFFEAGFSLEGDEISDPVVLRDFIAVLSLVEERTPDEDSLSFVESYFPFVLQQYQAQEVERTILDRDKLVDNFAQTFDQYVRRQ